MFQETAAHPVRPRRLLAPSDQGRGLRLNKCNSLLNDFEAVLAMYPGIRSRGPDPIVARSQRSLGLSDAGLAVVAAQVGAKQVTFVAVPRETWSDQAQRAALHLLRGRSKMAGRRVILVPASVVYQEPRLANARLIASCLHIPVKPSDRIAVMSHQAAEPGATLEDCAMLVRHHDPVESVLGMVARGVLSIRTDEHIGPFTRVDLASPTKC
jgi:hypothetical protein